MADRFAKRHADVLRKVDEISSDDSEAERNFASGSYLDGNGQERRAVDMDRDGFMLLVMSFTGSKPA